MFAVPFRVIMIFKASIAALTAIAKMRRWFFVGLLIINNNLLITTLSWVFCYQIYAKIKPFLLQHYFRMFQVVIYQP